MTVSLEQAALLQQEPTIEHYFQTFNSGAFDQTAGLFAADGQMIAPFEEPIAGRDAITAYLNREAEGMKASPKELTEEETEGDRRQIVVRGQVQAKIFTVNAAWIFVLTPETEIEAVRIKLLASLQELVSLRG
jgi:ketosteroid isomerase-like protein